MCIRRTGRPPVDIVTVGRTVLGMEDDPRAWIAALRSGHDRLAEYVASASADDLTAPSMCSDWSIAQVLSHLGSGAEIGMATVTETPVENQEVWDRWNALSPTAAATAFVDADERLVVWWEARTDDELATMQVQLPFLPTPIDAAAAAGFRLSELALHSWDVLAPADPQAEVAADAAALLIDRLPMMVGFVGQFTPRETRPADDTTIAVRTSDPERTYDLELGARADLRPSGSDSTAGELNIPTEALVRLAAGRLPADREHGAAATGALGLDDLRRAFPGY
jgi:uncharacterized protein (TIGR03083 family)